MKTGSKHVARGMVWAIIVGTALFMHAVTGPQNKVYAMGSASRQSSTILDIALPSGLDGVRNATAPGDNQPLGSGRLRVYRVGVDNEGLPASVIAQAQLMRKIGKNWPTREALADVSDHAVSNGVSLRELAMAGLGDEKYTMPNRLLWLGQANGGRTGLALLRIADDAPEASVPATLFCLAEDGLVILTYLAAIKTSNLIQIKDVLCESADSS